MSRSIQVAPVRKSVVVGATMKKAFDVFTTDIDRWWPKTHGIGATPIARSVIEPFVGGRWYAQCEDATEVTTGHVLAWDPPQRFVVSWEISAQWKPDPRPSYASEVEVRFIAESANRTRVELEHRNFERMGDLEGQSMRNAVDNGWPGLLDLFAAETSKEQLL
jgi:uncharacterized protein YndB with AHSA1/START domain